MRMILIIFQMSRPRQPSGPAERRDARADEPPTTAQLKAANEGPTASTADDASLLTVPVAQSAIAVDAHALQLWIRSSPRSSSG